MRIAADTSVLIAALLTWHERHDATYSALNDALGQAALVVLAPTLIEAYSVMTRLPTPHRLSPDSAMDLLAGSLVDAPVVALGDDEIWPLLRSSRQLAVAGGRVYDAHIFACAKKAGVSRLLTLNPRHFETLEPDEIVIEDPA